MCDIIMIILLLNNVIYVFIDSVIIVCLRQNQILNFITFYEKNFILNPFSGYAMVML
ncbi:hypothetical protein FHW89_002542 [Mucilaginibacter sp. SG564]|nr:hypothetical protein [Mucilaginibacter sp. SG564]